MSNKVVIMPTVFIDAKTGGETYGYRAYDDYAQTYFNIWEDIPDNDMDILKRAIEEHDETLGSMFEYVQEYQTGITIGDDYYEWEEIALLFNEDE